MENEENNLNARRCELKAPFDGNREALGWAIDSIARTVAFIAASLFFGVSVLNLAKLEAGCIIIIPEGEISLPPCDGRLYGFRPSSLVTLYTTVVSLLSAISLPIVGAVLDHTTWRKPVGTGTAVIHCLIIFIQIFLTEGNWMFMIIIQVIAAFLGWVHTLAVFAYLPELSPDPGTLATWTTYFNLVFYIALFLFLLYMIPLLYFTGFDQNHIISARIASASSFVVVTPCFGYVWLKLMQDRPASQPLREGSSLWTVGFHKVARTAGTLRTQYRSMMWFFINVSLVEAAIISIGTVSVTYMTDVLIMTSVQVSIAVICLFISGIIGTLVGKLSMDHVNPIRSNQLCQVLSILNTTLAAVFLTGPRQQARAYAIASGWGFVAGWKNLVERFMTTQIIPKGQDAELMGFYLFSSQVLSWLPTLIFTMMNEAEVNPRLSLGTMNVFFVGGILALWMMGSYEDVVLKACAERNNTIQSDDQRNNKIDSESDDDNAVLNTTTPNKNEMHVEASIGDIEGNE